MRIFHIATAADWAQARRRGAYTTSTRGRTLEEEGFIHASRREQVAGVFRGFYADADEPLVLLTIDTDQLDVPWREDPVGEDTFPHLYGALSPRAVVAVQPMTRTGGTASMTELFVREALLRAGLAVGAMLLARAGAAIASSASTSDWAPLMGALAGLAVGALAAWLVLRRRR